MAESYLTRDGYKKLQEDLKNLKSQKKTLSSDIGEAREKGDLKENAEYHAAKEKMGEVLGRIGRIEEQLAGARMIEELTIKKDEVQIGVRVTLQDDDGDEYQWTLVGTAESDPAKGRISVDAPLARGILGHKVGEKVKVALPAGDSTFKIVKTERGV